MKNFIAKLFGLGKKRPIQKQGNAQQKKSSLALEQLENRLVPAVNLVNGNLVIDASYWGTTATVNTVTTVVTGAYGSYYQTNYRVYENGAMRDFSPSQVYGGKVIFNGSNNSDFFQNNTNLRTEAYGNGSNDVIYGGSSSDTINGGDANDRLYGREGNDRIGAYVDANGIWRDDVGRDEMYGGAGNDTIGGGFDNDLILGEGNEDELWGDYGDDTVNGGEGNDKIYGWYGNDRLGTYIRWDGVWIDDPGRDEIYGWFGSDTIGGGEGDDLILGEADQDELWGDYGNDTVNGGDGNDRIFGWVGNDTLGAYQRKDGVFIDDPGQDSIWGWVGNDTLNGGTGNDYLYGEQDNDNLYGGANTDWLYGGNGNDGLFGGAGTNYLYGEGGADRFLLWQGAFEVVVDGAFSGDNYYTDAQVRFVNGVDQVANLNGFGNVQFAAGSWTEREIERFDVALGNLHQATNNTKLLKTAKNEEMTFVRVGAQLTPTGTRVINGWNSSPTITFTNNGVGTDNTFWATIYHEMGHNWDDPTTNRFIGGTDGFRSLSGWTVSGTQPAAPAAGVTYLASGATGDNWWYKSDAQFSRTDGYGQWSPYEDYATTWEAYFMDVYHGVTTGYNRVQAKQDNVTRLFNDLRTYDW